jgi:2-hydroxyglutaryl-CoA dehydratase, D-component
MTGLEQIIDRTLSDPLAAARGAERAIGYVGPDLPMDLLLGSGLFPCHLPWDADRPHGQSARWIETSFAPWTFSILDAWLEGAFDFFEYVLFSRGDDSSQRLYYYVCELQRQGVLRGPPPLIFDVARIKRQSSLDHTVGAVRELADRLDIGDGALRRGIEAANRRRRLFAAVAADRDGPGSFYERIARAALFNDLDEQLAAVEHAGTNAKGKVLLAGSAPPDDRVHRAIEATGWTVVGEFHDHSLDRLGPEIDIAGGDPAARIGAHAHNLAIGPRAFGNHTQALVRQVRLTKADVVVLWLIEQDEARLWQVPAEKAALDEATIPTLVLARRRWDAADGTAEDIAQFLEGRKL